MCLLNRNIHSLYCGSAVHQVRRIFKAVPSCWNIASFSPLMYLPCKQQQFVQKYNQRWPKSPSVVATFAAVSEATEYTALWGTLACSNMGSSQVLVLQSMDRIRRFLLPGSEQWLGKPINRWILGHPIYEKHIGWDTTWAPIPQSKSHIKLYWEEGNCVHQTIL